MPTIKDTKLSHIDAHCLLEEAIANWRPDRPRRWLAKYGNWSFEGKSPQAKQYMMLRREAERLLARPRVESANGLPSHTFHY
ncbi:hypothetical protein D3C72_1719660 [compost metagenome]